jgi:acyl transferase domain-containing protein/NAD(P)-dependent dehydrogenase (short-subunit alcohol dehydrogenase family)/acyl carrier protein
MTGDVFVPRDDTQRLKRAFVAIETLQARLADLEYERSEPIAVVGMGCRFPGGGNSPAQYWQLLRDGVDAISRVPADRGDADRYYDSDATRQGKVNTHNGGFLDADVYAFDPQFFGISPREALQLDPQQRLLLEVVWEALEHASIAPDQLFGSATGVFVGISSVDYAVRQLGMQSPADIGAYVGTGSLLSPAAGRISYALGLTGPSTVVDTACSSSLLAVHLACQSLRSGESDLALSAGVNLLLDPELSSYFSTAGMLADDGHCKTFSAAANGYVRSEGCGAVALKRLSDARADGDAILAVIRGSAANQDGASGGLTVPSGPSQERVIRQALRQAGMTPDQIDYIEAHGTGTPLGDPIEVGALGAVFGQERSNEKPLYIGSAKSNVGHTEAAAGMVGLIKVVLALQHREIPANLHFDEPNPQIPWDTLPVRVPTDLTPWEAEGKMRAAGISSFGFSGTNVHVVIEEAPAGKVAPALGAIDAPTVPAISARPYHLLAISAKSAVALRALAADFQQRILAADTDELAAVCHTAATGRAHFPHRLALVAADSETMAADLLRFATGERVAGSARPSGTAEVAFLFTGQGAQYAGMGQALYESQPLFRQTLDTCAEILRPALPKPLVEVLFGDADALNQTRYAQPALFALEYALYQVWSAWGIEPAVVMGHSLGEYVAACVAGVFGVEEGLMLVAERARLMDALPRNGAMATAFCDAATARAALNGYEREVVIAALNGPTSTVVSGARAAVEEVVHALDAQGINSKLLNVSHAFHSPLMEPMLAEYKSALERVAFATPHLDIVSNLTGKRAGAEMATAQYWLDHIREPVRFAAGVNSLYEQGNRLFLEVGPRPALLGMARAMLPDDPDDAGVFLSSLHPDRDAWRQMLQSLAHLYSAGGAVDWGGFERDYGHRRVQIPTYAFQRARYCIERPRDARAGAPTVGARPHPLVDRQIQSPLLAGDLFETFFHVGALPLLEEHQIYDQILVSGASHLSLVLGAVGLLRSGAIALDEIFFQQALVVPAEGCQVQLGIGAESGDARSFELVSSPESVTHVTGRVLGVAPSPSALADGGVEAVWDRCPQRLTADTIYQIQLDRHIALGPSYRWLAEVGRGDGEAICRIERPGAVADAAEYQLPPGLLDACFGLLAVSIDLAVSDTFIPFSIEALHFYQRPRDFPLHAHLRLRETSQSNDPIGDIQLVDARGAVIAELQGISGRRATREQLRQVGRTKIDDWFYAPVWQPAANAPVVGVLAARNWLVLADERGVGRALAAGLERRGDTARLVYSACGGGGGGGESLDPLDGAAWQHLFTGENARPFDGIIHLWGLDASTEDLTRAHQLTCASALHLVQALAARGGSDSPQLFLLGKGAQAIDQASVDVAQSALWGLGKVIALEHPELRCTCLDLDPEAPLEQNIDDALRELSSEDREDQRVLRGGERYVPRLQSLSAAEGAVDVRDDSSYLVAGGLGALGLCVAQWLVDKGAQHLVLAGRRAASVQAQTTIETWRQRGVAVAVVEADIAVRADASRLFSTVAASMPPLRGVLHAAGVLDDGVLQQQRWQDFEHVLRPKVDGAWNLHDLTSEMSLDFFVCFSSMVALFGSPAQGNYVAANSFMDALAHYRRARSLPALSINWCPWARVGMAADLQARDQRRLAKRGVRSIDPEDALCALDRLMGTGAAQAGVLPIDWSIFLQVSPGAEVPPYFEHVLAKTAPAAASTLLANLRQATADERPRLLATHLKAEIAQVLELGDAEAVEMQHRLFDLGIDSLMAVELRNRVKVELELNLSATLLFDYPTLEALVPHLLAELGLAAQQREEPVEERADVDQLAADIGELSEEQAEALLRKELEKMQNG